MNENEKREMKINKKNIFSRKTGLILVAIQLLTTCILFCILIKINMIPMKYLIIAGVLLLLISLYNIFSQYTKGHIIGKVLSVMISAVMIFGSIYGIRTNSILFTLTRDAEILSYSVNVLKDDSAVSIDDMEGYTFGYVKGIDDNNVNDVFDKINQTTNVNKTEYYDWQQLSNAIMQKQVDAVIFNEVYRANLNECYDGFSDMTKVIKVFDIEVAMNQVEAKSINEPFIIYLSGNDEEGEITSVGRSDVNILVCINPSTRQILLVSTPRDCYIMLDNLQGTTGMDKLTHAGNFGVQGSITALENLYDVSVDYYIKVNFTGTVEIIDALGGITVNSDIAFATTWETSPETYYFNAGENECNGAKALAFCRERKAFTEGDFQRGRNQMEVFRGIFKKATSPSIIYNYLNVMDSVSDCFSTNIPMETISSLVKQILNDSSPWTIQNYATKAESTGYAYSTWDMKELSMDFPDESSVQLANEMMNKILNGEVFDVNDIVDHNE